MLSLLIPSLQKHYMVHHQHTNTPLPPPPQVFTREELELIAELCIKHDVIAVCDEVYEHLVFNGAKHISLRSLPGMAQRTIRMGSAGKTFSFTAWKVGYMGWGGGMAVGLLWRRLLRALAVTMAVTMAVTGA